MSPGGARGGEACHLVQASFEQSANALPFATTGLFFCRSILSIVYIRETTRSFVALLLFRDVSEVKPRESI